MIWLIAKKDFFQNLLSARFIIGFLLCLVIIPFTLIVGVDQYNNQVRTYRIDKGKQENKWEKEIRVYSQVRPEIIIEPEPLSILSNGIGNNLGNSVRVNLGEYPLFPDSHNSTRDNPLLNAFFSIDFSRVISILVSLLALVFSYDLFSREREDGTMKMVFSNRISRPAFLAGKLSGIIITLVPILLFCFILGVLVIVISPSVQFGANDWSGIILLLLSSFIYMIVFILIGMLISSRVQRSSTSIIMCLLCWIWFLFLMPNIASYMARSFVKIEMYDNVLFAMNDINKTYSKERNERWKAIDQEMGMGGVISHSNYSSGPDGVEIMSGCTWEVNEFHRRLNIWKEPARIDYADKKWAIQKQYLDGLVHQENVQKYISWLSPAGLFEQTAEVLCRTSPESFLKYMEHVRNYRETLVRYFKENKLFESYSYFTPQPESTFPKEEDYKTVDILPDSWNPESYPVLNLNDVPRFEYKGATTASMIHDSLGRVIALLGICAVLLAVTIVSFIRYDIR